MNSDLQIREITVEAFRGFRDKQTFQLDATAIIISGRNGTGKTSFFDALQWCLLGSIQRLEVVRARPAEDHIVNAYRLRQDAHVELLLKNGTQSISVNRTGNAKNSFLTLRHRSQGPDSELSGQEAEQALRSIFLSGRSYDLSTALLTTGLMEQDRLRAILEAKPKDQFTALSGLLGLDRLEEFESAVRDAHDEAKRTKVEKEHLLIRARKHLESSQGRLAVLEERALRRPTISAILDAIDEILVASPSEIRISRPSRDDPGSSLRSLADWLARTSLKVAELNDRSETLVARECDLPPEPDSRTVERVVERMKDLETEVKALTLRRDKARKKLESAQRSADDMARLAGAALPLLTESCPVCLQQIDPSDVAESLTSRALGGEALASLHTRMADAISEVEAADAHYRASADEHSQLIELVRAWESVRLESDSIDELLRSMQPAEASEENAITIKDRRELDNRGSGVLKYLHRLRDEVSRGITLLEDSSIEEQPARALVDLRNKQSQVEIALQNAELAKDQELGWRQLRDGVVRARVDVTRDRITSIEPIMADIFSRLDPHPTFKTIRFDLGDYYRQGTAQTLVTDHLPDGSKLESNPLLIFSTSQGNVAALSAFLAMNITAGARALPFILLDDPIQSMDNVNVLAFSDLCRHLRKRRQLIVSTHFEPFGRLLARKLAPRELDETARVLEFVGWDRSGPIVKDRDIPYDVPVHRRMYLQAAS